VIFFQSKKLFLLIGHRPPQTDTDYFLLKNRREQKSVCDAGKLKISNFQLFALFFKSEIRNPKSAIGLLFRIGLFRKNAAVSRLYEFEGGLGRRLFKYILQKRSGIPNVQ